MTLPIRTEERESGVMLVRIETVAKSFCNQLSHFGYHLPSAPTCKALQPRTVGGAQ